MNPIRILLVEDNEGDVLLTTVALEEGEIDFNLNVVNDGKEAINFLNKEGKYAGENQPELIFLDINLPKKNGHEVLKYIKENENLQHIPVIMLTTSSSQKDIDMAYDNKADGFISKPPDVKEFLTAVVSTVNSWIPKVKDVTGKLGSA